MGKVESRVIKSFFMVLVCVCLVCMLAACSDSEQGISKSELNNSLTEKGKLKVASPLNFAPFETMNDGQAQGYSIAVITEAASRLGLELEIEQVEFSELISALDDDGGFDVAISSFMLDSERQERVSFTDPYYISDQVLVIKKGTYTGEKKLKEKVVAAQLGSANFDYAKQEFSEEVLACASPEGCLDALVAGQAQAALIDSVVAENLMASGYSQCEVLEQIATGDECGFMVNKNDSTVLDVLNQTLQEMEDDGTLEKLYNEAL